MKFIKKHWMSIRKRLRLAISERFFLKRVGNTLFLLDIRNKVDRHVDVSNGYETKQVKYLTQLLKNSGCGVFCDIGAHWGYYSILLAKCPGFERVEFYAFEPDKVNRYQLYANLFINKLEQVIKVYTCGLSDYDGEASFQSYDESNRGKSRLSSQGDSSVTVNRLDGLLSFKDEVIGFKIDVEGHEVGVVAGMQELLKNNKCILQIESFADKLSSLSLQMENLGYKKIHSIKNDHYFSNIGNI